MWSFALSIFTLCIQALTRRCCCSQTASMCSSSIGSMSCSHVASTATDSFSLPINPTCPIPNPVSTLLPSFQIPHSSTEAFTKLHQPTLHRYPSLHTHIHPQTNTQHDVQQAYHLLGLPRRRQTYNRPSLPQEQNQNRLSNHDA